MIFLKSIYHLNCLIKKLIFLLCYGKKSFQFGRKLQFRKGFSLVIEKPGKVIIGNDCFFNNYCSVAAKNKILIGSGTIFGENVKIYDHNHKFNRFDIPIKNQGFSTGSVEIGNHCWIGSNVTILKGAKIGDNCVIGAGCVVNQNVPSGTILKPSSTIWEKIKIIPKR